MPANKHDNMTTPTCSDAHSDAHSAAAHKGDLTNLLESCGIHLFDESEEEYEMMSEGDVMTTELYIDLMNIMIRCGEIDPIPQGYTAEEYLEVLKAEGAF